MNLVLGEAELPEMTNRGDPVEAVLRQILAVNTKMNTAIQWLRCEKDRNCEDNMNDY